MDSIAMIGLAFGMRHAMDVDHVAAVASLAARNNRSAGGTARLAACWGVGHAATILVIGAVALIADARIPDTALPLFDALVGVVLLTLGIGALRRSVSMPQPSKIDENKDYRRATLIGAIHGVAGSAALMLLTAAHAHSVLAGLVQLALFGAGAVIGMCVLSLLMSLPMNYWARNGQRIATGLIGFATGVIGLWMLLRFALQMHGSPFQLM